MQKHVKELIGQEMSAQLYPLLFDQIRGIVEKFFDQQGQVRPVSFNIRLFLLIKFCTISFDQQFSITFFFVCGISCHFIQSF